MSCGKKTKLSNETCNGLGSTVPTVTETKANASEKIQDNHLQYILSSGRILYAVGDHQALKQRMFADGLKPENLTEFDCKNFSQKKILDSVQTVRENYRRSNTPQTVLFYNVDSMSKAAQIKLAHHLKSLLEQGVRPIIISKHAQDIPLVTYGETSGRVDYYSLK